MPTLLYQGFSSEGHRVNGSGNYASKEQMKEYLNNHGIENYEIFNSRTIHRRGNYSLISPKELSIFCKQMSVLFFSNITLKDGVLVLADQTENKQLKLAMREIHSFMEQGYTFAESMCMYDHLFTAYLLNMIVIGESSGTLDTVFSQMSSYFDKEHKIRKNFRSAITYPAILTALMAAIIVLLIVKVLPIFGEILESMGTQVPTFARFMLNVGSYMKTAIPIIIIVTAALTTVFMVYTRMEKRRFHFDKVKLSIPIYRYIYSRIITSRFSRGLSILLKSGTQLVNALQDVTKLTGNKHLEKMISVATEKIKYGDEPDKALAEINIFPPLFLKLFVIGNRTGNLDEMLEKAASVFDDEADDSIKRFTDMLEPILIIILSLIVGTILVSVMIPIITIINSIG